MGEGDWYEFSARSVEDAIEMACGELGVAAEDLEVDVISESRKGIAGLISGEARIRARVGRESQPSEDRPNEAPSGAEPSDFPEDIEQIVEAARAEAQQFVEGLLEAMGLEGAVVASAEQGEVQVSVRGQDLGLLIGRHGQTLESAQELLRTAVQRRRRSRVKVWLDVEGYWERRRMNLERRVRQVAREARREGQVEMEPMPAAERKIIHDVVSLIDGLTSFSDGEEPQRRVIIRVQD